MIFTGLLTVRCDQAVHVDCRFASSHHWSTLPFDNLQFASVPFPHCCTNSEEEIQARTQNMIRYVKKHRRQTGSGGWEDFYAWWQTKTIPVSRSQTGNGGVEHMRWRKRTKTTPSGLDVTNPQDIHAVIRGYIYIYIICVCNIYVCISHYEPNVYTLTRPNRHSGFVQALCCLVEFLWLSYYVTNEGK